jgi:hypothetical protein
MHCDAPRLPAVAAHTTMAKALAGLPKMPVEIDNRVLTIFLPSEILLGL